MWGRFPVQPVAWLQEHISSVVTFASQQGDYMDSFLVTAKNPIRLDTADQGPADFSLDDCPRPYRKELLATFPDCCATLRARPVCKPLLLLAVFKTSMSMASFSPDTGA